MTYLDPCMIASMHTVLICAPALADVRPQHIGDGKLPASQLEQPAEQLPHTNETHNSGEMLLPTSSHGNKLI